MSAPAGHRTATGDPGLVRLRAVAALLRPLNFLMFLAGVALGGWLAAGTEAFSGVAGERLLVAAVSAALIGGAANSLNDVFDLEIDRLNRPDRPLPSGRLSPAAARRIWGAGSAAGVLLAAFLSAAHVTVALLAVVLLFGYSARLKRTVLWGNAAVALLVALTLVYGGLTAGDVTPALVAAVFAFLTTLAREIVKDLQDASGDAAQGARTLPVVYGAKTAGRVVTGVLLATLAVMPVPFLAARYSGLYLLVVLAAAFLLLRVLWLVGEDAHRAAEASACLKGVMFAGMVALALGGV